MQQASSSYQIEYESGAGKMIPVPTFGPIAAPISIVFVF